MRRWSRKWKHHDERPMKERARNSLPSSHVICGPNTCSQLCWPRWTRVHTNPSVRSLNVTSKLLQSHISYIEGLGLYQLTTSSTSYAHEEEKYKTSTTLRNEKSETLTFFFSLRRLNLIFVLSFCTCGLHTLNNPLSYNLVLLFGGLRISLSLSSFSHS